MAKDSKPCTAWIAVHRKFGDQHRQLHADMADCRDLDDAAVGGALRLLNLAPWDVAATRSLRSAAEAIGASFSSFKRYLVTWERCGFATRVDGGRWVVADTREYIDRVRDGSVTVAFEDAAPRGSRALQAASPRAIRAANGLKRADSARSTARNPRDPAGCTSIYQEPLQELLQEQEQAGVQRVVVAHEAPDADASVRPSNDDVDRVLEAWLNSTTLVGRKRMRVTLTPEHRQRVLKHLKAGRDVETLIAAVQGWTRIEHNRGGTDGRLWNGLDLLLRSAGHVDRFSTAWFGDDVAVGPMTSTEREHRESQASDAARALTADQAAARDVEREEWRVFRAAIKARCAGVPVEDQHPDFRALWDAQVGAWTRWRDGTGGAPPASAFEILDVIPVRSVPVEPEPVSAVALRDAAAHAQAAQAAFDAGVAAKRFRPFEQSPEMIEHAEASKVYRDLLQADQRRRDWEAWVTAHADDVRVAREWATGPVRDRLAATHGSGLQSGVLRSGATGGQLARAGTQINLRADRGCTAEVAS